MYKIYWMVNEEVYLVNTLKEGEVIIPPSIVDGEWESHPKTMPSKNLVINAII